MKGHAFFSCSSVMALAIATSIAAGGVAGAQTRPGPPVPATAEAPQVPADSSATNVAADEQAAPDIVVTGFRASLSSAINAKRRETAAIDSIVAEDIGKFPDSNLAESMQRVPGVALARGDGGEGRNISVRGLGAAFTRVRINGMEGTAQTGSSDIYGGGNNGRSFDFNVFPTEIFSALAVRKTPSADVEDGSLGATVDLNAPKPFDSRKDFTLTATARGVYNELSKKVNPRLSALVSTKFGDFGILASVAYQQRDIREVGYSAVDILSANTNGLFCSPIGFTPATPAVGSKGADAANCYPGVPRTSTAAAFNTIYNARRTDLPNTPGSGAFFPRLPRYLNSQQDQKRLGGTLTLQYKPDDATDISLDLLYSRFHVVRRDNYIAAVSFARSAANNGQPVTSVKDIQLSPQGSLVYGLFDGVDVRSEGLVDDFTSTFKQANLNIKHDFDDRLSFSALIGLNEAKSFGKQRFQYFMDAIDTSNFSVDYRKGGDTPILGFGFDVSDPTKFNYAPGRSDGTVLGGYSFQARPSTNTNRGLTGELNFSWKAADILTLKAGGQYRRSDFTIRNLIPYSADLVVRALPAGTSLASITRQIAGVDQLWGNGAPASWASLDPAKLIQTFGLDATRYCGVECGAQSSRVLEEVSSGYAMAAFDLGDRLGGVGVRGDAGVRYVKTDQFSSGFISVSQAGSPTGLTGRYATAYKSYDDWLPSANVVVEPIENLLFRFSGAKVLARPELGVLTPTSGVNPVTRSGSIQNPQLDPIRANTFDAAIEWYFRPGALLSAAFFYKDIKSYVQNVNSLLPFDSLGLPNELLIGSNTQPGELFTIAQPINTPGGPLKGIEVNAQVPFTFLPGFLANFGALANYTHVTSRINYVLASVNGVPTVTTTADLVGLSPNTASGTLYYEDKTFSLRGTANYRSRFIRGIPASPGSDLQGNDSTLFVDASASINVTDAVKLIVEATNLTDEQNRLYVDSVRQDTLFQTRIGRTVTFGANLRF
ncbi:TonB-dependent receptor [Sphingomonas sp. A2-49]|uniref:TonB-dependent receptor n=1 Tax=Sphingomonas sp. A2-49 TaxID=1391375 RepID=UPI0021D2C83A|nr:TonB-dependent receptor [Sphingomonas sp. A2-49]MCU6454113.1 TonB-dependent receptor [Sphingomonas sp. A2-49]